MNDGIITKAEQFISNAAITECHMRKVPPGAIVIGLIGEGQTRGRTSLLGIEATVNQNMAYIIVGNRIQSEYLWRQLHAAYAWIRGFGDGSGGSQSAMNCSTVRSLHVAVPPVLEQAGISEMLRQRLSNQEELCLKLRHSLTLLHEYRQTLITAAVTGKIPVPHGVPQ